MNLLPKSREEFSQKEYWDSFFKKRGSKAFEWYGEYPELCGHLHKYIKPQDTLLIVGCGNSTLGNDLYDIGYKNITNIDISQVVIRQMNNLNEKQRPSLLFLQMDALNMTFEDDSFSVVFDKGTFDALMPDDEPSTLENTTKYLYQILRVLKIGGRYVCVSLLQEHILKKLLDYFPSNNCMLRIVRCHEAEAKAIETGENAMPVFLVICTKFKALSAKILEVNLASTEKMQRCRSSDEIISLVASVQQAAFVCSGLKHSSIAKESEVAFDLYESGRCEPRFTVYVIDVEPVRRNSKYAAFIVPQGREAEWLFSTKEGRKHLAQVSNHNRLSIVTMHRGQKYDSLNSVQAELSEIVKNLALSSVKEKIPFLSLGSDVGSRTIRYEGNSKYSGDYVIEDVEVDGSKLRRLYYLQSQLVIQSEARLKSIRSNKRKTKEIVDPTFLTCNHHIYMSLAAHLACENKKSPSVAIIGLGGGALCTFLHRFIPKAAIKAVDIDEDMLKIATEWFGLSLGERLDVEILDGIRFLDNCRSAGKKFDAILFDVDSKDNRVGMSCPPKQFLEPAVISNVMASLEETGVFIVNVVVRDETLRAPILNDLRHRFGCTATYKLKEDLNEVVICTLQKVPVDVLKKQFENSCGQTNSFFKRNGHGAEKLVDLEKFGKALKIFARCE